MQPIHRFFLLLVLIFCSLNAKGQLSGTVYDDGGEPLPYVTVYVDGTSKGTVSNGEGQYVLDIESGDYLINYKFIGYKEQKIQIKIDGKVVKDVVLKEESINLEEIVVSADAEDPAYAVIRKAIKARKKHKSNVEKYEVDLYVKGVVKMLKAPEKILGQEIGDMEGMLDSTRQGIVYLAESQSKIHFHQPDLIKEEMYSSIVAEDDGSFNFNRFIGSNFDIYEEYFEFSRSIMNPLADNAFLFYDYKMLETKYDSEGRLINRIKVIPKSSARPTLFGELYIIEDKWNVKELDLSFTGKAIKEPFFDTVQIRQVHLPVENDKWMVFSQTMGFKLGFFGFKIGGGFTYVFSDYNLNPDFDQSFFGKEEFKMDEDAIKTDSTFWTEVRPIKLTTEEKENYIRKDSLKKVWSSKTYKDSIDRVNNKFSFGDFLFGYSYANSWNREYFSYSSPLSAYRFNAVEGHTFSMGLDYVKLDSIENRRFNVNTSLAYGFSDKRFKHETTIRYRSNKKFLEFFTLKLGDTNRQMFEGGPIGKGEEMYTSLLFKNNQGRYFNKRYMGVGYQREISNGVLLQSNLMYAQRLPLNNNTEYSWRRKDQLYDPNYPEGFPFTGEGEFFEPHNTFVYQLNMRFRIGQTYSSFPRFRIRETSDWPTIWLRYEKGLSIADTDYDKLSLQIVKNNINMRLFGYSNINIEAKSFLNKNKVEFIDYHHFYTNDNLFALRSQYSNGFKLMPHYTYSTTNDYAAVFYEHNFDGYLLDLVPLVNKLGWSTVVSGNALVRNGQDNYYEVAAGIHDVKIGAFSIFRMDYVWTYGEQGLLDRGIVIGLSSLFEL